MSCGGFEPTIPASERVKTVHALDHSATVTGHAFSYRTKSLCGSGFQCSSGHTGSVLCFSGLSIYFYLGCHPPSLIVYLNEELFTWEITGSQGSEYEGKL
jgi:hypothetical protein